VTIPERARAPYGTPHVSLLGASSIGWPNDGPALTIESSAGKRPTLPMTNRDGVSFHSDYIPPPPTSPQVSARRVRPARWRGPELPGVFRADSAPPDQVYAFAQVTGLRPKVLRTAKTAPFRYPNRYIKRASEPRFRRSEAFSHTWWQVKDSNLRSFRDGFTDQRRHARDPRKRPFHRQLTCAFPTDTRRQPTAAGHSGDR
jgi:hypothetical protein